jgi:hypothetical protein
MEKCENPDAHTPLNIELYDVESDGPWRSPRRQLFACRADAVRALPLALAGNTWNCGWRIMCEKGEVVDAYVPEKCE